MNTRVCLCLLTLVVFTFASVPLSSDPSKPSTSPYLETLTFANFSLATQGTWIIKLYAPWCGHCKHLAPTWAELAEEVHARGLNVHVAESNVDAEPALMAQLGIHSFPTILHIINGEARFYKGSRELQAFLDFVGGKYTSVEPENKWFGPTSVAMRALGYWVMVVLKMQDAAMKVYAQANEYLKLYPATSPVPLQVVLSAAGATTLVILITCCWWCCHSPKKPIKKEISRKQEEPETAPAPEATKQEGKEADVSRATSPGKKGPRKTKVM